MEKKQKEGDKKEIEISNSNSSDSQVSSVRKIKKHSKFSSDSTSDSDSISHLSKISSTKSSKNESTSSSSSESDEEEEVMQRSAPASLKKEEENEKKEKMEWNPSAEYESVYRIYDYFDKKVPFNTILCVIHQCYGNLEEAIFKIAKGETSNCKLTQLMGKPLKGDSDREAKYYN